MKNHFRLLVLLAAICAFPTFTNAQPRSVDAGAVIAKRFEKSPSILDARGRSGAARLDQLVTVRGFYYDGSIPMIVDSIERTQCNMMMPPSTYVPLAAPLQNVRSGDEISVAGRLVAPLKAQRLDGELSVLRLEGDARSAVKLLRPRATSPLELNANLNSKPLEVPRNVVKIVPTKYAVLLAGGGNAANNHPRYWNDLGAMYGILLKRGYAKSNIFIVYADGNSPLAAPIYGSATKANLNALFQMLGAKMTAQDELYIMMDDHGGGFLPVKSGNYEVGSYGAVLDPKKIIGSAWAEKAFDLDLNENGSKNDIVHFHNTLSLWNETMTEQEFSAALQRVKNYKLMIIQMNQCFSGGFAQFLRNDKRIIMSSSGANELSWSHSTVDNAKQRSYTEFFYWYCSGLMGFTLDSWQTAISASQFVPTYADANGDKEVSLVEAWNFARKNQQRPQTPHYADSLAFPASGPMPAGGHGALGSATTFGTPWSPAN